MFGALAVATLIIAAFDPLTRHAFGDRFVGAVAYNSLNGVAGGSTEGTIGATPYLPVLAGIQAGNIALAVIISATFAIWIWFWIPNIMAYGTRSMIAWSFDRVAPDRLGYVSGRFSHARGGDLDVHRRRRCGRVADRLPTSGAAHLLRGPGWRLADRHARRHDLPLPPDRDLPAVAGRTAAPVRHSPDDRDRVPRRPVPRGLPLSA